MLENDIRVVQVMGNWHLIPCADWMGARKPREGLQMENCMIIVAKIMLRKLKLLVR